MFYETITGSGPESSRHKPQKVYILRGSNSGFLSMSHNLILKLSEKCRNTRWLQGGTHVYSGGVISEIYLLEGLCKKPHVTPDNPDLFEPSRRSAIFRSEAFSMAYKCRSIISLCSDSSIWDPCLSRQGQRFAALTPPARLGLCYTCLLVSVSA